MNLTEFHKSFGSEEACREYLANQRWGSELICPHCSSTGSYIYSSGKLYKCKTCKRQYTVRVGTIFGDSKIPLTHWFLAIFLATSLKKGISSTQLAKYLGVTQKTSWFMLQRIRYAIEQDGYDKNLDHVVEVDETYVGGKRRGKRGRGAEGKTPVVGLAEREGKVRATVTDNTKGRTVKAIVRQNVKIGAILVTDEYRSYNKITELGYIHEQVNHSKHQYSDGLFHANTIEGFWSHLKRGIDGIYHHVSSKYLNKYVKEYEYHYNTCGLSDSERFDGWFNSTNVNISYRSLIQAQ